MTPWQTIDQVNRGNFFPGDQILLEGGATFSGTIVLAQDDVGTPTPGAVPVG